MHSTPLAVLLAAALALGGGADRAPRFEGRWRIDRSSISPPRTIERIVLRDGSYSSESSDAVAADGRFHSVATQGYSDEIAVAVVDGNSVHLTTRLKGEVVAQSRMTVSRDGRTLVVDSLSKSSRDQPPMRTRKVQTRVGSVAGGGAHLVSGGWRTRRLDVPDDPSADWLISLDGRRFSLRSPDGTGYTAELGGAPVPLEGDGAGAFVAVTMPRRDTVVESDSLGTVVGGTLTMRILPDGRTMRATSLNVRTNASTTYLLRRR